MYTVYLLHHCVTPMWHSHDTCASGGGGGGELEHGCWQVSTWLASFPGPNEATRWPDTFRLARAFHATLSTSIMTNAGMRGLGYGGGYLLLTIEGDWPLPLWSNGGQWEKTLTVGSQLPTSYLHFCLFVNMSEWCTQMYGDMNILWLWSCEYWWGRGDLLAEIRKKYI